MKKILAVLLCVCAILSLTGCGSKVTISSDNISDIFDDGAMNDNLGYFDDEEDFCVHDWSPATFDSPAKCTRCGETSGEKLAPATEWGFYNLYEIGNCLISIDSYDLSDANNSYIIATGGSMNFENGYVFGRGLKIENGKAKFGTSGDASPYSIVNNDVISISNGYKSYRIGERKTASGRNNFVCFVVPKGAIGAFSYEDWFVPYSLIDWDRGAEYYTNSDGDKRIKLYLIS